MACCTMQAEDAALPRGDTEDTEVYRKHGDEDSECQIIDPDKVLFMVVLTKALLCSHILC